MSLSGSDACLIIEASAKAGVSELSFGTLHVKFGRPAETREMSGFPGIAYPVVKQHAAPAPMNDLTDAQHKQQARDALELDEILTREDQLARALVEDPVLYEELLQQGELTDGMDDADDADIE